MTRLSDRYATAVRLRKDGKTFREIGAVLGVCAARARQMVMKVARDEGMTAQWYDGLSTRVSNALRSGGLNSKDDVVKAFQNGELKPRNPKLNYIGVKGIREIVAWLGTDAPEELVSPSKSMAVKHAIDFLRRRGYRVEKVDAA